MKPLIRQIVTGLLYLIMLSIPSFRIFGDTPGIRNTIPVWIADDLSVNSGQTIEIPVITGDLTYQNVNSFELELEYDPDLISAVGTANGGTLSAGYLMAVNRETPGIIRIASAGSSPLSGNGTLMLIRFTADPVNTGTTSLLIRSFRYNEGTPDVAITSGKLSVTTPRHIRITFQVNTVGIVPGLANGETTGIRGNLSPLSWSQDIPMSDPDQDHVFTATITVDTIYEGQILSFKYSLIRGNGTQITLEENPGSGQDGSRELILSIGDTILPVVDFKSPLVGIASSSSPGNDHFKLYANYPNPFNDRTTLSFRLDRAEQVQIHLYNTYGQMIQIILNRWMTPGNHHLTWISEGLPSGIYYCSLRCGTRQSTRKLSLLK